MKTTTNTTIKLEVWSDIMCPYCHIGKKLFEKALDSFTPKPGIDIVWKAFQLNQSLPGKGKGYPVVRYLRESLGLTGGQIEADFGQMKLLASEAGIPFNLDNAVAANTRDAHRLIKLAAEKGKGSKATALLGKAYFEDAKDYSDYEVLAEIGQECGLTKTEVTDMIRSHRFVEEVEADIREADELGIDTIPTFLFNRKYAVIGSQPVSAFVETLQALLRNDDLTDGDGLQAKRGKSCSADGVCSL